MYPVLFDIGHITIYSLGIFWALGALAAVWILQLEFKRCNYDAQLAGTIVMAFAIDRLIGARSCLSLRSGIILRESLCHFS